MSWDEELYRRWGGGMSRWQMEETGAGDGEEIVGVVEEQNGDAVRRCLVCGARHGCDAIFVSESGMAAIV